MKDFKSHHIDAFIIASNGKEIKPASSYFFKKLVPKGDYKQTYGIRSEIKIPTGKLFGFRKFDLVRVGGNLLYIKSKRSRGYFQLMDYKGTIIEQGINAHKHCTREVARKLFLLTRVWV